MRANAETGTPAPAHDGLFYASDEQLLQFVVPFVRDGIAHHEAVVVVAHDSTRKLLEPVLADVGPVEFVSPPQVFRRTVGAVRIYQELVQRAVERGAPRVRAISQVDFGAAGHGREENVRFEAVANLALAAQPLWNVCLYDVRRLPDELVSTSAQAHPYLVSENERWPNPDYVPPAELLRRHSQIGPYRVEAQPPDLDVRDLHAVGLSRLRKDILVTASAGSVLPQEQIDDFLEAVNEIVTNSLVHGKGPVSIRVWVTQQRIVCTVTDRGGGFDDPLAGFLPGPMNGLPVHGAGLWLARNFTDSLDFSTTENGLTARLACWTN